MAKADQTCANLMEIMRQEGSKDNPETLYIGTMRSATSVEIDGLVLDGDDVYIAAHLMAGYQFPLKTPYVSSVNFGSETTSKTNPAVRASGLKKGDLVAVMKCNKVKEETKMGVTAQQIIDIMDSWVGLSRAKGTHKPIIDLYNSHKPLARGYAVTYTDNYCDATVSAAFIKAGAVDLIGGTECGVEEHVKLFKKAGIWIEDGTITPEKGDIIVFNWDDATQPNDGYSDHIEVVRSVASKNFETTGGNMNGGVVGHRTVPIGWGYIRGFARPKYSKANTSTPKEDKKPIEKPKEPTKENTSSQTYTVKAGDNLTKIAKKYGTTVQVLVDLNNIKNKDLINVGQVLKLPGTKSFCVGCRVRVNKSATHYATGQKIASFVKGSEYKVIQVGTGKCLLGGIVSWVKNEDLTLL